MNSTVHPNPVSVHPNPFSVHPNPVARGSALSAPVITARPPTPHQNGGGGASSAGANWAQLTAVQPQKNQLTVKVKVSPQPQQQQHHTLQQQHLERQQQKVQQQQQEAIGMLLFNGWVKASFWPKLTMDQGINYFCLYIHFYTFVFYMFVFII